MVGAVRATGVDSAAARSNGKLWALRSCQFCYRKNSLFLTSLCRHRVQTISSSVLDAGHSWVDYCWDSLPSR